MAALQNRNGSYRVFFEFQRKQRVFTIGRVGEDEATAKAAQIDYLLLRLKQNLIELPAGVGIVEFMKNDGKIPLTTETLPDREVLTLRAFRDRYLDTHRPSLEARTVDGIELHFKHLLRVLGEGFPIPELRLANLQEYADARAKAKGHSGKRLSPATIKKEIISLRTAWNWGEKMGFVSGRFPNDGLRYPKGEEKPVFQTRQQIERQIAAGRLTQHQKLELWHALYLQTPEIEEALEVVRQNANHPWIYAMACTAAHTGARRSELIRMRTWDVDFSAKIITVREKKRVRGKLSTRRVPLTPFLEKVLSAYLKDHPGGEALFCHAEEVERSKKRSPTTGHQGDRRRPGTVNGRRATVRDRQLPAVSDLTEDEAHDHLKRSLKGSKWAVIKGWHVWRHGFIGACASKGVDQRFIDEWVGHQSEAMRRRYRHLYPDVQADALKSVFS